MHKLTGLSHRQPRALARRPSSYGSDDRFLSIVQLPASSAGVIRNGIRRRRRLYRRCPRKSINGKGLAMGANRPPNKGEHTCASGIQRRVLDTRPSISSRLVPSIEVGSSEHPLLQNAHVP
jgi:hypothetical protein